MEGFHLTSYQANFVSTHTRDRPDVSFLHGTVLENTAKRLGTSYLVHLKYCPIFFEL